MYILFHKNFWVQTYQSIQNFFTKHFHIYIKTIAYQIQIKSILKYLCFGYQTTNGTQLGRTL